MKQLLVAGACLLVAGCSALPPPRPLPVPVTPAAPVNPPAMQGVPPPPSDVDEIPDAVPRDEPRSAHGNPPFYDVNGTRYTVLSSSQGFVERGVASWYGPTFHGKNTSSGEPYDMYAMTAAHRTLPIPCYARITNLSNGRSVIVRINDRGPFASNRIVDLSYTAAAKLDIIRAGTAFVELRTVGALGSPLPAVPAIDTVGTPTPGTNTAPAPIQSAPAAESAAAPISDSSVPEPSSASMSVAAPTSAETPAAASPANAAGATAPVRTVSLYIQVGAYGEPANANKVVERIQAAGITHVYQSSAVSGGKSVQRVRVGPVSSVAEFDALVARLAAIGLPGARIAPE